MYRYKNERNGSAMPGTVEINDYKILRTAWVEYVNLTSPLGVQPDAGSSMRLQTIAVSSKKMRRKAASHSPPQPENQLGRRKTAE